MSKNPSKSNAEKRQEAYQHWWETYGVQYESKAAAAEGAFFAGFRNGWAEGYKEGQFITEEVMKQLI